MVTYSKTTLRIHQWHSTNLLESDKYEKTAAEFVAVDWQPLRFDG